MNLRRTILASALVVLAALLVWVAFLPLSGAGVAAVLGAAALALAAAGVLFVRRRLGSALALLVGAAGFFLGGVLAGLETLGNQAPGLQLLATAWLGVAVAVLALADLVASLLVRGTTEP